MHYSTFWYVKSWTVVWWRRQSLRRACWKQCVPGTGRGSNALCEGVHCLWVPSIIWLVIWSVPQLVLNCIKNISPSRWSGALYLSSVSSQTPPTPLVHSWTASCFYRFTYIFSFFSNQNSAIWCNKMRNLFTKNACVTMRMEQYF